MRQGVTLIELLVALAILGIVLSPLVVGLANSLKATGNAAVAGEVKAAAIRQLEKLTVEVNDVINVNSNNSSNYPDEQMGSSSYNSYKFIDYYYACAYSNTAPFSTYRQLTRVFSPAVSAPALARTNLRSNSGNSAPTAAQVQCNNGTSGTVDSSNSLVTHKWFIYGEPGANGEGVVTIWVTSTHLRGLSITLVNRVSCFDINTLISDKPITCSGGARP